MTYLRGMRGKTSTTAPQSKGEELREIGNHLSEIPIMLESTKRAKELFKSVDKLPKRKTKARK